jgi:release factor glutamine methyltransferase
VSEPERSEATWRATYREVVAELRAAGLDTAEDEARWIVEQVSGEPLPVAFERAVPERLAARTAGLVDRRVGGEPLQYVLGAWSFRGLDVMVDRRVLIPRPETEVVAEVALQEATRLGLRRARTATSTPARYPVADLGTGSGVLALSLLAELPDAEVWATDASPAALAVARANLAGLGAAAARARVAEGSWFAALPRSLRGALRLVVSNPPYVAAGELAGLDRVVRDWEPRAALVSGPAGTEALHEIVTTAPEWLAPAAVLVCELAPAQAAGLAQLARRVGFADVEVRRDLAGRDRVLVARTAVPGSGERSDRDEGPEPPGTALNDPDGPERRTNG